MNNNTTKIFPVDDAVESLTKVVTATYITTGSMSLLGNGLVIAVMMRRCRQASIFKILLTHLAICDIIFALALIVDTPNWMKKRWVYPPLFCKLIPPAQFTSSIAAEGTVVVIAIERYRGISHPLKVQWNKRDISLALMVSWIIALASASPFVHSLRVAVVGGAKQCVEHWNDDDTKHFHAAYMYTIFTFIGNFVLPMLVLAVLYGRIIVMIRKPIDHVPCFEQLFRKRRKKDIRITRLLIFVIVAFALCVLPNHLGHFINTKMELTSDQRYKLAYVMLIPYPFQCVLNPIIYSIVDKKFRKDAFQILQCQREKSRRISRTMTSLFRTDSVYSKKAPHSEKVSVSSIPNRTSREEEKSF